MDLPGLLFAVRFKYHFWLTLHPSLRITLVGTLPHRASRAMRAGGLCTPGTDWSGYRGGHQTRAERGGIARSLVHGLAYKIKVDGELRIPFSFNFLAHLRPFFRQHAFSSFPVVLLLRICGYD